jgi:hypothetical protein
VTGRCCLMRGYRYRHRPMLSDARIFAIGFFRFSIIPSCPWKDIMPRLTLSTKPSSRIWSYGRCITKRNPNDLLGFLTLDKVSVAGRCSPDPLGCPTVDPYAYRVAESYSPISHTDACGVTAILKMRCAGIALPESRLFRLLRLGERFSWLSWAERLR